MRTLLLGALVLAFLAYHAALATNSTYSVSPTVFIRPPFPNSKLILTSSNLTVDPGAGKFYLTVDTTYSSPQAVGVLPRATLIGNIAWQQPGLVLFSFSGDTSASCFQALSSSPPLCPYLQSLVNGPFYFGASPSTGATVAVTLEASTTYIDPNTGVASNFLGANIPLAYVCIDTCEEFGAQVPPSPLPENLTVTTVTANTVEAFCNVYAGTSWNSSYTNGNCGSLLGDRLFVGFPAFQANPLDTRYGYARVGGLTNAFPSGSVYFGTDQNFLYPVGSAPSTILGRLVEQYVYGEAASLSGSFGGFTRNVYYYGTENITLIKSFADNVRFMANFSGVVTTYAPYSDNVFGYAGGVATIINYQPYWSTTPIGVTITNSRQHRCDGTGLATGINACFSSTERTGATNNAWAHMDCNTVNDGCSLMAGTAFDTKWSRCRAGAWCPGTGQDIYTESGFLCAGTGCSVLSTSLVGVYDGSDRAFATVSCTGATCTKSGKNLDIVVAGVTSITGTANQITASASTGAVTLSTPNPFEANQAAPKINSYGTAIGTAGSLGTIIGSNNAFWVTVTTGSTPSAGGLIARLDWATAWTSGTTANGPACRVSITNPEGVADPAGFMSTYGPKLYAIPVSGSANDSLDLKLAAGASGVALPAVTSFQVLVTCNLVR